MTKTRSKRNAAVVAACLANAALAAPAHAANWLMLQGTENPKAPAYKLWGFIQPSWTQNYGDAMQGLVNPPNGANSANNGKYVANNLVAPELEKRSQMHLRRARAGVRGRITDDINYFFLAEFANNNITFDPFGDRARVVGLTDVSVTFNQIKGARVRAGLFKNPGSEELLQAIHTFDYIDFTDFTARDNLERFATGGVEPAGSPKAGPAANGNLGTPTTVAYGFSAGRDWGLQVFDSFKRSKWDLSYAVKLGRGEGIASNDHNFNPEWYFYGSAEYALPGGKGPMKNGVKLYAWHQQGKREFRTDPTATEYQRIRQGIGFKALGNLFGSAYKHRISGEFMLANGMVFVAPAGNVKGGRLQYAADKGNKARGWYLDYGLYLNPKWELDIRYDRNDLLYETSAKVNPGSERKIEGTTLGASYHFNPKTRLTVNYTFRQAEAPTPYSAGGNFPGTAVADRITGNSRIVTGSLGDRLAVQLTMLF